MSLVERIKQCWSGVAQLRRGDAYACYLRHWQAHHARDGGEPLSRAAFFRQSIERKWSGVKRCC